MTITIINHFSLTADVYDITQIQDCTLIISCFTPSNKQNFHKCIQRPL